MHLLVASGEMADVSVVGWDPSIVEIGLTKGVSECVPLASACNRGPNTLSKTALVP